MLFKGFKIQLKVLPLHTQTLRDKLKSSAAQAEQMQNTYP